MLSSENEGISFIYFYYRGPDKVRDNADNRKYRVQVEHLNSKNKQELWYKCHYVKVSVLIKFSQKTGVFA